MDMEEIEKQLESNKMVQRCGFMDLKHFEEFKEHAANGLLRFGDVFEVALGSALSLANITDSLKIVRYWQAMCDHYVLLYRMYLAKAKAEQQ